MRCSACGADVVRSSVYCHKCGERLDDSFFVDQPSKTDEPFDSAGPDDGSEEPGQAWSSAHQRFRGAAAGMQRQTDVIERELWSGGYCGKAMMGAWILGVLASVGLLVVAIAAWNVPILRGVALAAIGLLWIYQACVYVGRKWGVHYRLTSQRFFHEKGILVHTTDLIEVIDMDDITYSQTILDRWFGVGAIRIVSSDRSHPELSIQGIDDVKDVASKLHEARHAERIRRGLHIESI